MPFRRNKRLDTSQVEDVRGRRIGRGTAVGGGIATIILALIYVLVFGGDPGDLTGITGGAPTATAQSGDNFSNIAEDCLTGQDANTRTDCRVVGFVNSIQDYWTSEFESQGVRYALARTQLYSGATQAACGYATSAVGPFYCPADQKVYLDISFFEDLENRFGAQGGPFAEGYVLAHEYGHHVQDTVGILDTAAGRATGPNSNAVRTELQADCLAGVWARNVADTGYLEPPTREELNQALDAAAAVGDDRIQREMQGYVSPESWTHGSSQQRQEAFIAGYNSGDPAGCDCDITP